MSESRPVLQKNHESRRRRSNIQKLAAGMVIVGAAFAFAHLGFSEREPQSVQSKAMLARSETYGKAVQPGIWPPGYPLVLLLGRKAGLPPRTTNLLLFCSALLLLGFLYRQVFPESNPLWAVLLYASCGFNYYNLSQFTSEALVVPLALCAFSLLLLYLKKRTYPLLLGLSMCCAAVFISRYHALAWLLPLFGAHLLFSLRKFNRLSFLHLATFGLIALIPVAFVMRANYKTNGHLTGMPRLGYDVRKLPDNLEHYRELTGADDNIRLTAQTLFVDFLSPRALATHEVNQSAYRLSWLEWGVALILAFAVGIAAFYFFRGRVHLKKMSAPRKPGLRGEVSPGFLLGEFFVAYVVITVILWSVGNNDPIYTRFLYPSYPFLILWGFAGYSFVKKASSSTPAVLPFILLYLSIISINLYKIVPYLK